MSSLSCREMMTCSCPECPRLNKTQEQSFFWIKMKNNCNYFVFSLCGWPASCVDLSFSPRLVPSEWSLCQHCGLLHRTTGRIYYRLHSISDTHTHTWQRTITANYDSAHLLCRTRLCRTRLCRPRLCRTRVPPAPVSLKAFLLPWRAFLPP